MTAPDRSPWGQARYELKRRRLSPREALGGLLGAEETDRLLSIYCRVDLEGIHATERKRSQRGDLYAPPRSASAELAEVPVRSEHSEPVIAMSLLLLSLMVGLMPGKHRVGSARHYLGDPSGKRAAGIPRELMRSTGAWMSRRELQRYLVVFRDHRAGPSAWQPRKGPGIVCARRSGRPYNFYDWSGLITSTLAEHVAAYHAQLLKAGKLQGSALARPAPSRARPVEQPREGREMSNAERVAEAEAVIAMLRERANSS